MPVVKYHQGIPILDDMSPGFLSSKEFSEKTGVSRRMIQRDNNDGKFEPGSVRYLKTTRPHPDLYIHEDQVEPYIILKSKRQKAKGIQDDKETNGLAPSETRAYYAMKNDKLKAERTELELQRARNELIPRKPAMEFTKELAITIRQGMLALPAKVVPRLVGQTDVTVMTDIMSTEIEKVLTDLSKLKKFGTKPTEAA